MDSDHVGMLLNADPKSCARLLGRHPNRLLTLGDKACAEGGLQATQALDSRIQGGKNGVSRRLRHGSGPTRGFVPYPQVGPGASVGLPRPGTHSYCVKADTRVVIRNYALRA